MLRMYYPTLDDLGPAKQHLKHIFWAEKPKKSVAIFDNGATMKLRIWRLEHALDVCDNYAVDLWFPNGIKRLRKLLRSPDGTGRMLMLTARSRVNAPPPEGRSA